MAGIEDGVVEAGVVAVEEADPNLKLDITGAADLEAAAAAPGLRAEQQAQASKPTSLAAMHSLKKIKDRVKIWRRKYLGIKSEQHIPRKIKKRERE